MGGKSGKADAGPMLEYGDKALALQKEQYDYSKQISQPWLNTGTSAINSLSSMMGLSGGGKESRQSFYDKLAPQYTTTAQTQSPNQGFYVTPQGTVVNSADEQAVTKYMTDNSGRTGTNPLKYSTYDYNEFKQDPTKYGFKAMQTTQSSPTVDTAALNAAVDEAYNNQAADENYGKLLETYSGQDIYNDPSYKFRLDQGNKAMERQLSASGKYLTPAASLALQEYGQNMGSQEYQNAYNRFNTDQTNLYNRLANLSGMGQTQSSQVIGAGQNYANAGSDIYTGQGNAITSAQQANQANKGSMFNTLLSAGAQLGSAYMMSDERLKQDIKPLGKENGHNIYEFAYKSDPSKKFIGVMASEVQKTHPEAVEEINGYLAVDYDKIGVTMKEV